MSVAKFPYPLFLVTLNHIKTDFIYYDIKIQINVLFNITPSFSQGCFRTRQINYCIHNEVSTTTERTTSAISECLQQLRLFKKLCEPTLHNHCQFMMVMYN